MGQASNVVKLPKRNNQIKQLLEKLLGNCNDYSKVIVSVEAKNGKVIHEVAKNQ